ncbi:Up-regulated during septation-domain-containing protein [Coniella lustricola]|uniref:Up-regulated during septation-domain-containing protein n=1 Tax=Coniella lustricola TaxID=2025994 RepID=A0A2T3AIZ4_9PEZI|nr:Up-regulated during septation-domain-containing protein [Coniella lustricola]
MDSGSPAGYGYNDSLLTPQGVNPGPKQIMNGYRADVLNGFGKDMPQLNPLNPDRPQSSVHVDLKDPIQVHLLTETALTDSKEWQILSQEEVDELKKQIQSLTVRIEQARANLAIQTKYRDAAIAMTKLYHSAKRMTVDPKAAETQMERETSERNCEELASELFYLEKRIMEPQRRLLQHTAGILQLTHKAAAKNMSGSSPLLNGMPGSPESLYTGTNGRNSLQFSNDDIDDRSLYFPLDDSDPGRSPKTDITIPPRSPVRQRTNQLKDEVELLKQQTAEQTDVITRTERTLEDVNSRLRDMVIQTNPTMNTDYQPVPSATSEPGVLDSQLQYLNGVVSAVQEGHQERESFAAENAQKHDSTADSLRQAEQRITIINMQVHDVIATVDAQYPQPPGPTGTSLEEHFDWIDAAIPALQTHLEKPSESAAGAQQAQQIETVLTGLWEIIQSGYAEINRQREARKQVRLGKGMPDDDDDVSSDESFDFNEAYSLTAFSTKVQWLFRQATSLKEQKSVLKRQIRQQRELNSRGDGEKDIELRNKVEELQRTKNLLAFTEENAQHAKDESEELQKKLDQALADLDTLQTTHTANNEASSSVAQEQLRERNAKIISLEADTQALRDKLEIVEAQLGSMNEQLADVDKAKQAGTEETERLEEEIKARDEELEQLNVTVIELKTELTIAKAELDGAYGSRSERAAEAAALTKNTQLREMTNQIEKLKQELAGTVKELEDVTKETLASEREKNELEARLDEATINRATLETEISGLRDKHRAEVSRLKEELEAEKFKAGPNATGTGPRAGATMLSEQFRTMMKEERKRFQEEMKEEQGKRRKLEDELRTLKKASGALKSPISPRE